MVKKKPVKDIIEPTEESLLAPEASSKVPMRDIEVDEYLLECVTIEPTMLEDEFVRAPAEIAYWNEKLNIAVRAHLLAKLRYDQIRAKIGLEVREEAAANGVKKTVGDIDAMVTLNPQVAGAYLDYVEAESERQALRNRCDAVQAKREMLQSLGAKYRVEMATDPVLRDQLIANQLNNR
jgi:hypothetical protein